MNKGFDPADVSLSWLKVINKLKIGFLLGLKTSALVALLVNIAVFGLGIIGAPPVPSLGKANFQDKLKQTASCQAVVSLFHCVAGTA
jgi:hypothetical protein